MTAEGGADSVWDAAHRPLTAGLVLTVSMTAFEALAVATALPAVVRDLGGLHLYGWAFSGFMLTNLLGITAAGRAADRRGVALPFLLGIAAFIGGLFGAGLASSMLMVVLSRLAQGLGAGAISAVAYVAIARAYAAEARPRMVALLSSAWVVPGLIGPGLAGVITDHLHWRWVFLGLAPLTAGAAALAIPALRRLAPPDDVMDEADSTPAALALAVGTGLALSAPQFGSPPLAGLCVVVGALIAIPALRRLMPPGTLRARPGLPATIATVGLLSAAFFGAEAFLPLTLTEIRGQTTMMAGIALSAATVSWTSGAWVQARLAPRRDRRRLTVVGLLAMLLGIAGLLPVLIPTTPIAAAIVTWAVTGFGIGIAYSTTALVVLESAPRGGEGAASAALQLANVLGVALGTGVGGAVVAMGTDAGWSASRAIAVVDVATILAAALALLAARGIPARPPAQP
ncbi:MAG: MFS transporter [bacterium]